MHLIIDNYDSFTYTLVHALNQITGTRVDVFRNDKVEMDDLSRYTHFVLSPGPGIPDEAGMLHPFKRPGLGFEIDKSLLRKYGKRFFKITETRLKIKVIREKGIREALAIKKRKEKSEE